jgi:hypothetical protein
MVLILANLMRVATSNGMSAHSGPVALGSNSNIRLRIILQVKIIISVVK